MARSIKNLIAAVLISISCYLAWVEILPMYYTTSYLKNMIEEKQGMIASRTEIIDHIEKLRKESSTRYNEVKRLALVLPDDKSYPELITAIEKIHSQSGLVLSKIALGDSDGEVTYKVDNTGTYSQLFSILTYMEKNIRVFDIEKLDIGVSKEDSNDPADPKLGFNFNGKFYWLKQQEGKKRMPVKKTESEI